MEMSVHPIKQVKEIYGWEGALATPVLLFSMAARIENEFTGG